MIYFQYSLKQVPDAYTTRIWKTTEPVTRQTAFSLLSSTTPIANVSAGISTYEVDVPEQTDADYYYSITYFLPNWIDGNQDYEDIRFLSNNALTSPNHRRQFTSTESHLSNYIIYSKPFHRRR
jgi:hypothetical protein